LYVFYNLKNMINNENTDVLYKIYLDEKDVSTKDTNNILV